MQKNSLNNHEIICVGDLCADLIIPYGQTRKTIQKMKDIDINNIELGSNNVLFRSGGSVGNTARVLGKLGESPIFITNLGNDNIGQYLKKELEKDNVNMNYVDIAERGSYLCIAVLDENNERTMFVWVPPWSEFDKFTSNSFPKLLYQKKAIVFSSGMVFNNHFKSSNNVINFFKKMKKNNALLVFDLNIRAESYGFSDERKSFFLNIIKESDIILGSGVEEFKYITGKSSLYKSVQKLAKKDKIIIARDGSKPVLIKNGKKEINKIKVKEVDPVNTVGAGDTFNAAFLFSLKKGNNLIESVKFANDVTRHMIQNKKHLSIPTNIENLLNT